MALFRVNAQKRAVQLALDELHRRPQRLSLPGLRGRDGSPQAQTLQRPLIKLPFKLPVCRGGLINFSENRFPAIGTGTTSQFTASNSDAFK